MKGYNIVLLPGDGIGPEVTEAAVTALEAAGTRYGFRLDFQEYDIGGIAIDRHGVPLPDAAAEACKRGDAVFLGAVGGPKWDKLPLRPEAGLLGIRAAMGLFANLRPAVLKPFLRSHCPLKGVRGFDLLIFRELTGGLYYGEKGRNVTNHVKKAYDTLTYSELEAERIIRHAFRAAQERSKRLCSVDKANVLETSRLWRETAERIAPDYPDVTLSHMYVDNAAMQLCLHPAQFDVIVTENMFGDILSDEAAALTGSIGLLPSASLGAAGSLGLFEPVHGSAPELAGRGIANPAAAVLSAALLLRYGLGETEAAAAVENAVWSALKAGSVTADLARSGQTPLGTRQATQEIAARI